MFMRDIKRISRILGLIVVIWRDNADMRFGQLYENLLGQYCIDKGIPQSKRTIIMWNFEDDDFENYLKEFKGFGHETTN
jgi:hypothetical protein